jgi:hypothetical protein
MTEPEKEPEPRRPWERRGAQRLDCEPHRGTLLRSLGTLSLVLAFVSLCGGVAGVFSLTLGIPVWIMARRDLRKMGRGVMDITGEDDTFVAKNNAAGAISITLAILLFWVVLVMALSTVDEGRWIIRAFVEGLPEK